MFPLSALPRCVALRSKHGNSYLRSVHDKSQGGNFVELSADNDGGVMNPRCRFYLEASKEHDGLVHVRCCYNNKYWAPQQRLLHGSARWTIGTANELEEDLSKPSCTLFKHIPVSGEDGSTCRFLHSQLGKYACVLSSSDMSKHPYLHIAREESDQDNLLDAFTVLDVSEQMQLPSYLAFKGDNGRFLGAKIVEGYRYLEYSKDDIGDLSVLHTIFTNKDGVVRIKSNYFDMFWRRSPNWIWADSTDTTHNNRDTLFKVTTGPDFIALRNLGNNNFCKRLTTEGKYDCLNAAVGSITAEVKMRCIEPIVSRDIYDVDFRLGEAKIYTNGIEGLDSQIVENMTTTTNKTKMIFTYTNTVQSTWSSTVSLKIGVKTKFKSGIPFVVDGEVEVSTEFSGSYTWGGAKSDTKVVSKQIDVEVPPMKKVTVKAIGSNGLCDIPFSYKQRDILTNGDEVIQEFTDGMYFGVKTSSITFHTKEEHL
uniref:Putative agglutinin n=1 Tax=Triticum aestivum TaxID=4565 RepID=A0A172GYI7_WHEAT|nr:putative agglutinin [Triticum aestivum]AOZ21512.1 putative agglutinin protein [Triticum aestivum]